ncbi:hypothetical protein PHMEG_00021338 [Phytophthora megakarya]|uniref:RRM domain-containing protein n=1 Tax=Phytophthora megakarya TaxID=4795 RepID=A0A225VLV9_9STRA|nr:hypothetical protein PHMEG_00021338 [Phytophthora megakarya]
MSNPNAHRKMTPKGQMSSSGMGPAIMHLPTHLKVLFEPNAPLDHLPRLVKRKMPPYSGLAAFADVFEKETPPPREVQETPKERRDRRRVEKMAAVDTKMQEDRVKWDPNAEDPRKTQDAYKTLFVGRISYETTEQQLRHEFEQYGAVKSVRLVEDPEGKSRGYGFVEYEKETDMKSAYKYADGKKIDGRRVVVDVERGRTVRDWLPRKFGGGIGDTRKGGADVNVKSARRVTKERLEPTDMEHGNLSGTGVAAVDVVATVVNAVDHGRDRDPETVDVIAAETEVANVDAIGTVGVVETREIIHAGTSLEKCRFKV